MDKLVERLLSGDRRALAKAISLIENEAPEKYDILRDIHSSTQHSYIVGITGSPGSGKSTLVDKLITRARKDNLSVGILAVDPSSPFTGGALLGDRIRMQEHTLDPEVFIRSMGTRGALGGLSRATREAAKVLDAFKKDLIILETVGVGQSEVDIVQYADTTVLVLTPAGGDSVQTIKAGVMEIADLFVINKADFPGTEKTYVELESMLELGSESEWRPRIIKTVASEDQGVGELFDFIFQHYQFLQESGYIKEIRKKRIKKELIEQVEMMLSDYAWKKVEQIRPLEELAEEVWKQNKDPYSTARELVEKIVSQELN